MSSQPASQLPCGHRYGWDYDREMWQCVEQCRYKYPGITGEEDEKEEEEDKESSGSSQSLSTNSSPSVHSQSLGSVDSWSSEKEGSSIGSFVVPSSQSTPSVPSEKSLDQCTPSSPEASQRPTTSGKSLPACPELSSSWEPNPFDSTCPLTGTPSGVQQYLDNSWTSRLPFEFVLTGISERLREILLFRLQSNVLYTSSGVRVVLASQGELGKKLPSKLTLRIPAQSSGVAIGVKNMLSSMNLMEASTYPTSSAGSIGIRSSWKQKEELHLFKLAQFGSPPISPQKSGSPSLQRSSSLRFAAAVGSPISLE